MSFLKLGSQSLFQNTQTFHRIFLAVDFDINEYLYLQCNDLVMDLSGVALNAEVSVINPYAFVFIYFASAALANQVMYFDDVKVSEVA